MSGASLLEECRKLKEACKTAEERASRLEINHRALEGELQRSRLHAGELETERATLQERVTSLRRELGESEQHTALLKVSFTIKHLLYCKLTDLIY